jgi:hypothetical protein
MNRVGPVFLIASMALACGENTESPVQGSDAGADLTDSGSRPNDGGPLPLADGGPLPPADAGPPPPADAGPPPPADAGPPPPADAGPPPPADAGPPPPENPMCHIVRELRRTCMGCHAGAGRGGYALGDGSNATIRASFNNRSSVGVPYVSPGSSARSYLFLRIAGRGAEIRGGSRVRMPLNGRAWPNADQAAFQRWIDQGALDFRCP